jgi:hypothetical protein
VNYVSAHDNETLFDTFMLKASPAADLAERCRMNHLATALVALSQVETRIICNYYSPDLEVQGARILSSSFIIITVLTNFVVGIWCGCAVWGGSCLLGWGGIEYQSLCDYRLFTI